MFAADNQGIGGVIDPFESDSLRWAELAVAGVVNAIKRCGGP